MLILFDIRIVEYHLFLIIIIRQNIKYEGLTCKRLHY